MNIASKNRLHLENLIRWVLVLPVFVTTFLIIKSFFSIFLYGGIDPINLLQNGSFSGTYIGLFVYILLVSVGSTILSFNLASRMAPKYKRKVVYYLSLLIMIVYGFSLIYNLYTIVSLYEYLDFAGKNISHLYFALENSVVTLITAYFCFSENEKDNFVLE